MNELIRHPFSAPWMSCGAVSMQIKQTCGAVSMQIKHQAAASLITSQSSTWLKLAWG